MSEHHAAKVAAACHTLDATLLTVVIVTYNSRPFIDDCLRSLREQDAGRPFRTIVVDNSSSDGTPDHVARHFPEVEVVRMSSNIGFSAAANVGMGRVASGPLLLLNPDTVLPPRALHEVVQVQESVPDAAFVGCKLVRADGSLDSACRRSFPTVLGAALYLTNVVKLVPGLRRWIGYTSASLDADRLATVDAINGAFMLARRAAIEEIGLLDEAYWMYGEDLDWCRRAWDAGWTVVYTPTPTVVHLKSAAAGTPRRLRPNIWFHRAMYKFFRDHHHPGRWTARLALAVITARFVTSTLSGGAIRVASALRPHGARAIEQVRRRS